MKQIYQLLIRTLALACTITYAVLHTTYIGYLHEVQEKSLSKIYPFVQSVIISNTNYSKFKTLYNESSISFIEDPTYCKHSDLRKLMHPELIMSDQYIVRDLDKGNLQRQIIKARSFDTVPDLKAERSIKSIYSYHSSTYSEVQICSASGNNLLLHFQAKTRGQLQTGRRTWMLVSKTQSRSGNVLDHQQELPHELLPQVYAANEKTKQISHMHSKSNTISIVQLQKNASFVPQTYRLNVKTECVQFFDLILEEKDTFATKYKKKGPEYILKTDQHRGEGVQLLFAKEMMNLTETYDWGNKCASLTQRQVVQRYINQPYLFKIYIYIASTGPLQVYVYKRALIKRCASPYNPLSEEISAHICNTAIVEKNKDKSSEDENEEENQTNEDFYIDWDLDQLEQILIEQRRIDKSSDWLNNYLYPKIYQKIIHTIRSGSKVFSNSPKFFYRFSEFLAVDFILDDELDIWILEINYNPQILSVTEDRIKRNYKMIEDTVDIAFGFLRTRYQRFKLLIERTLMKEQSYGKRFREVRNDIKNVLFCQSEFNKKYSDYILQLWQDKISESDLKPDNLYHKIVDEHLEGHHAYFGLIDESCI